MATPADANQQPDRKKRERHIIGIARRMLEFDISEQEHLDVIRVYLNQCTPSYLPDEWTDDDDDKPARKVRARALQRQAAEEAAAETTRQKAAAEKAKPKERFPNKRGTYREIAERVGIGERGLLALIARGTQSREKAERVARELGCAPEVLLRPRARTSFDTAIMKLGADDFPFRLFAIGFADNLDPYDGHAGFLRGLAAIYTKRHAPRDFDSFEHFAEFVRQHQDELPGAASLPTVMALWSRFALWRGDMVYEAYRDAIQSRGCNGLTLD
jgi:hypothetical protein